MNPQGQFQGVTQLPKPVNTQALTFSQHTTIQSTPSLFSPAYTTQENGPPSLPHSPSVCPPPSRAPVHLVKNIHVGTLRIHSCDKKLAQCISDMQASIHGWNTPTIHYNQQNNGSSPTIRFSFPSQDQNE
jgi:hypothetical protein